MILFVIALIAPRNFNADPIVVKIEHQSILKSNKKDLHNITAQV